MAAERRGGATAPLRAVTVEELLAKDIKPREMGRSIRIPFEETDRLISQGTIPAKATRNGK